MPPGPQTTPLPKLQPVAIPRRTRTWASEQSNAHRIYADKAEAIRTATMSGKRRQPVIRDFLRSPHVKLAGALKALGAESDRQTVIDLKNNVNAWATSYQPVNWHTKQKASGGSRPICNLPPVLKATHYMIAEVIKRQLVPSAPMYGVPGKSRDDCARDLKGLQNAGFVHLAKTDIRDCYGSVNPDSLYQLPIMEEVTRQALDTRRMTFRQWGHYRTSYGHSALSLTNSLTASHKASGPQGDRPSGLLQGSPVSPIALAWLLNSIPTTNDARVMICFDNIVIAARTPEKTREMVDTLAAYLERCPAGPLALCEPEYADNAPLSFLGYLFDPAREDIGICDASRNRLERRLNGIEAEYEDRQRRRMEDNAHAQIAPPQIADYYPVEIWGALLDFRCGFSAASATGPEMQSYLEASADWAARHNTPEAIYLHHHLCADPGTREHEAIRNILNHHLKTKRTT